MNYTMARYSQEYREIVFRTYVTDSLQLIPQNKYITRSYCDIINMKNINDNGSADKIAADIIHRAGLKVK